MTKYPVDYALYRELLQNSADAKATDVEIQFYTESSQFSKSNVPEIRTVHTVPIVKLVVRNNGAPFAEDDWSRLKEIAKGNPNETKIGAFGVGFYSVFELTDEPLVHSGNTVMNFYYKGDQLHYRRTNLSQEEGKKWTIIDLPYRSLGRIPNLISFTAFLTQSFTLVGLSSITLKVDDTVLMELRKESLESSPMSLPRTLNYFSRNRTLCLESLTAERFQVSINYLNVTQMEDQSEWGKSLFGFGKKILSLVTTSKDPNDRTTTICFLRKINGRIKVSVSSSFAAKMKATVLKAPAKYAEISMLAANLEDSASSDIQPPLSGMIYPENFADARIFIGFPTKQSPGIKSHINMSQLIPTMERTAVDLSNAHVKDWNAQMLYMCGVIARALYEIEMSSLKVNITAAAAYLMDKSQIGESAPDKVVSQWISTGFWQSNTKSILVPTETGGVADSSEVRISDLKFLTATPILAKLAEKSAPNFVESLTKLGYIKKLSITDIVKDLNSHSLSVDEFVELVTWIANAQLSKESMRAVLDSAILAGKFSSNDEQVIHLSQINCYQNRYMFEGLPLPSNCIPYAATSALTEYQLEYLGWSRLALFEWLKNLVNNRSNLGKGRDICQDSAFSVSVLEIVAQQWNSLSPGTKDGVTNLLSGVACIPTQKGMRIPADAYLSEIPLFPDLAVKVPELAVSHEFLTSIGIRVAVEVSYVLKKLETREADKQSWSVEHVIQYLSKHSRLLKKDDWEFLRKTPFLLSTSSKPTRVGDLFAPNQHLAKLNLQVLAYNDWSPSTVDAQFLFRLGLKKHPTAAELFAPQVLDSAVSKKIVLQYYLANYETNDYKAEVVAKLNPKVVPCTASNQLLGPQECFTSQFMALFELPVVEHSISKNAWKMGVRESPPMAQLITKLLSLPRPDVAVAEARFSYLSSRVGEVSKADIEACSAAKIIPVVKRKGSRKVFWQIPGHSFILDGSEFSGDDKFFFSFFDCVNLPASTFGFLTKIGVRYRPSVSEVINLAVSDPQRVYDSAGGPNRYELFLTYIAENWEQTKSTNSHLLLQMQSSPFLLAYEYITKDGQEVDDDRHESTLKRPVLARASDIVIVDDIISFSQFKSYIKVAPDSMLLEDFYTRLGTKSLSEVVERRVELGPAIGGEDEQAVRIRNRTIERTKLFLESTREKTRIKSSHLSNLKVQIVKFIRIHSRVSTKSVTSPYIVETMSGYLDARMCLSVCLNQFDWLDLARTMVKAVLDKPNPDSVIILDLQLRSTLKELERKGYNVDRLLKHELEKRRAEEKERLLEQERIAAERLAEEKQERAAMEERERAAQTQAQAKEQAGRQALLPEGRDKAVDPPASPQSGPKPQQAVQPPPPPQSKEPQVRPPRKGLFSHIKERMIGTSQDPSASDSTRTPQGQPASGNTRTPQGQPASGGTGASQGQPAPAVKPSTGTGAASQSVLNYGISQTTSYNGSSLKSKIHKDVAPPKPVECSPSQVEHLRYSSTPSHLRCFVASRAPDLTTLEEAECRRFEGILIACANVFQLKPQSIHIFYDPSSSSIAFNTNGSLFFNLHYFLFSHTTGAKREFGSPWNSTDALDYWFPVMAHELAHNLVADHGASHSFFCESYIQSYLERFKAISSQWID